MSNNTFSNAPGSGNRSAGASAGTANSFIRESDFKDFPQVDVVKLIKLIREVSDGKKTSKEAAEEFGVPFMAFAKVFVANKSKELIAFGFDQASAYLSGTENSAQSDSNAFKVKHDKDTAGRTKSIKAKASSVGTTAKNTTQSKAKTAHDSKSKESQPKSDVQQMAEGVAKNFINEAVTRAGMVDLTETDFDERLIECVKSSAILVKLYMNKSISVQEFIEKLGHGEIKDITMEVLKSSGMDKELASRLGVKDLSEITQMGSGMVAFIALTQAYEMVRGMQEDLEIAKAHRAEIEAACNESIALIRQYRREMEEVVNKYLTDRIEIFKNGFEAMDKAILENDSNGYIQGNAAIQDILGYKPQFTNQEEFDDLMDSDEDFKL